MRRTHRPLREMSDRLRWGRDRLRLEPPSIPENLRKQLRKGTGRRLAFVCISSIALSQAGEKRQNWRWRRSSL